MDDENFGKNLLHRLYDCVNISAEWVAQGKRPVCTPRERKGKLCPDGSCDKARETETETETESRSDDICPPSVCPKSPSSVLPSKICPPGEVDCCVIKMQDPCAPCCCEEKTSLSACPPKCYPEKAREPVCGCDLCKKPYADGRCCQHKPPFSSSSCDPRFFEKA